MSLIAISVAAGSVLILTGPGGAPVDLWGGITPGGVRFVGPGEPGWAGGVPIGHDTVWAVADPTTDGGADVDLVQVAWEVPPGVYEVAVMGPALLPRTPMRVVERQTFQVAGPSADELELTRLRAARAEIDRRIAEIEARVHHRGTGVIDTRAPEEGKKAARAGI